MRSTHPRRGPTVWMLMAIAVVAARVATSFVRNPRRTPARLAGSVLLSLIFTALLAPVALGTPVLPPPAAQPPPGGTGPWVGTVTWELTNDTEAQREVLRTTDFGQVTGVIDVAVYQHWFDSDGCEQISTGQGHAVVPPRNLDVLGPYAGFWNVEPTTFEMSYAVHDTLSNFIGGIGCVAREGDHPLYAFGGNGVAVIPVSPHDQVIYGTSSLWGADWSVALRREPCDRSVDEDGDGLSDCDEIDKGADPGNPDTDGDGIPDGSDPDLVTPKPPDPPPLPDPGSGTGGGGPGGGLGGGGPGGETGSGGGDPQVNPNELGGGEPKPNEGCTKPKLKIGPVEVSASCWTKSKTGVWSAEGSVRAGGVDIAAAGFSADPGSGKLKATGSATVSVGSVTIYKGALSWSLGTKFSFGVPSTAKIKGLPIKGSVVLQFGLSSAVIDIHVGLPSKLGGVTGDARLTASSATGLSLNGLELAVGEFSVGRKLKVKKASLAYSSAGAADQWKGAIAAELPGFPKAVAIDGELVILDGDFKSARIDVSGFNKPICCAVPAVFLQSVGLGIQVNPLVVSGSLGLSGGPRILGGAALSMAGSAELRFGSPEEYVLSGAMKVVEVSMADGKISYRTSGDLDFGGNAQFSKLGFGINGNVEGWVDGLRAFNAEGRVSVTMPRASATGNGLISSRGVVACRTGRGPDVGASYRWGDSRPDFFWRSCGVGGLREPRARAAQATTRAFGVPAGDRVAVVVLTGRDEPPSVTITGPRGENVTTPAGGAAVDDGRFLLIQVPQDNTTYVAIDRPTAGTWKIVANPGSSPLVRVRQARPLPAVNVHAKVLKAKRGQVLNWTLARIPGQKVTFIERGTSTTKTLKTTTKARGSLGFIPAPGSGKRTIEAVVEQDGLPREHKTLTTYTVHETPVGTPRSAHLTRRAGSLHVTWGPAKGVAQYAVAVHLSDGRRLRFTTTVSNRRVTIHDVAAKTRATISIVAVNVTHHRGPPRTVKG